MNFTPIFNFFGKGGTAVAIILNIKAWLFSEPGTIALTVIISLLVIIYWVMKIYDQYLVTKKRKASE